MISCTTSCWRACTMPPSLLILISNCRSSPAWISFSQAGEAESLGALLQRFKALACGGGEPVSQWCIFFLPTKISFLHTKLNLCPDPQIFAQTSPVFDYIFSSRAFFTWKRLQPFGYVPDVHITLYTHPLAPSPPDLPPPPPLTRQPRPASPASLLYA